MMLFGIDIINSAFKCALSFYRRCYLPIRVSMIRKKPVIKVAFVVSDLGKWKTESLFKAMALHNRFEPYVFVTPYSHYENDGLERRIDFLKERNYRYIAVDNTKKISDYIKPDIIFYQEPYTGIIDSKYEYKNNLCSLFCYVSYAYHSIDERWHYDQQLLNIAWQMYFENYSVLKNVPQLMTNKGVNCVVTGLPMTDIYLQSRTKFPNPWKVTDNSKIKLIWAPHHTIFNEKWVDYSTFLRYSSFMLSLAEKYKKEIQIAFKPHPVLLTKLYKAWGKKQADYYYAKWANGENTQLVLGDYVPLFMYSDAMIHDCGSFTVEYHYTKKPVMYLTKNEHHADGLNTFGKMAFDLHYKGKCEEDIELFINNVIEGKDEMKEARERFYQDYLLPPDGHSASENIIEAILA